MCLLIKCNSKACPSRGRGYCSVRQPIHLEKDSGCWLMPSNEKELIVYCSKYNCKHIFLLKIPAKDGAGIEVHPCMKEEIENQGWGECLSFESKND